MLNTGASTAKTTDPSPHLFFFIDPLTKEVPFSSLPLEDFFETPVNPAHPFPFPNHLQNKEKYLENEWQHCLQLNEKETRDFNCQLTAKNMVPFLCSFNAVGINLPAYGNPVVLFSVKKIKGNINSSPPIKNASIHQKDYAEFIDIAAHDLDAPLRKLTLLMERMVHKYKSDPASDLQDYFDRIQTSLMDMRSLVDSLYKLAGLSGTGPVANCDIKKLVEDLFAALCRQSGDKAPQLVMKDMPVLEGDKEQFRQLFQNLLQNAIRFSKMDEPPKIEIASAQLSGTEKSAMELPLEKTYYRITVKDNGIGFQQEYAEKIFKPFVRLHGKSEYPGTGMGLAICKRIAENHGGIISAESNQNNGATFTLILPQSPT
jgi:nitrogen-specific signal transduction histidine kinase